jgi:hypothetical protein
MTKIQLIEAIKDLPDSYDVMFSNGEDRMFEVNFATKSGVIKERGIIMLFE